MTKKEACLRLVQQKGDCWGDPYIKCSICPIGDCGSDFSGSVHNTAYKLAVEWMKEHYPDELMELLI